MDYKTTYTITYILKNAYAIWKRSLREYGGVKMTTFGLFYGIVTQIDDFRTGTGETTGCYKLMTVQSR